MQARLRRMCEKKPSGKMNVPAFIHEMWAAGGAKREELAKVFEEVGENKDFSTEATLGSYAFVTRK